MTNRLFAKQIRETLAEDKIFALVTSKSTKQACTVSILLPSRGRFPETTKEKVGAIVKEFNAANPIKPNPTNEKAFHAQLTGTDFPKPQAL